MKDFVNTVSDFFLNEKNINIKNLAYKELPTKKEKYNLSKIIGNANLTEGRFKIKSEVDSIITNFISLRLP